MLYRHKQGTFEVCKFKATYLVKRDSIVVEEVRYIHDKGYFENILNKHESYSNLEYKDIVLTEEQQERYEQIRSLPESSIGYCVEYVESGKLPNGNNHPLRHIQLELENQRLRQELSEREINEIAQGMHLSDLEIQILEIKLGGI